MRAAFAHAYTLRDGRIVRLDQVADSVRFVEAMRWRARLARRRIPGGTACGRAAHAPPAPRPEAATTDAATRRALGLLAGWLLAAVAFTGAGGLRLAPPPLPQLILAGLTALLLGAYALRPALRTWLTRCRRRGYSASTSHAWSGCTFSCCTSAASCPGPSRYPAAGVT